MRPSIVVVGSANTDMVVNVNHLPSPGETILSGRFFTAHGGKGANQTVAAARLGANVTLVARLGKDSFGHESIRAYKTEGINTDFITWDEIEASGVALIMVDPAGENIIAVAAGANSRLSPGDVKAAELAIQQADCVLLQLEIPLETVAAAIELANQHNVRVILNPAPAQQIPSTLLNHVDTLTPNETEAAILAKEYSFTYSRSEANRLLANSGVRNLVITMGAKGALIAGPDNMIVPTYQVKSVDATGSGDAFNGGLAVALAGGKSLEQAVAYGNAVGALATTRPGAQPSLPRKDEVDKFLQTAKLKPIAE